MIIAVASSAGIHTYLNYNEPSVIMYYFLSFLTVFFETVSVSFILAIMHNILTDASQEALENKKDIIRINVEELRTSFYEKAKKLNDSKGSSNKARDLQIAKGFKKRAKELDDLLKDFDNYTPRQLRKRSDAIKEDFLNFLEKAYEDK